LFKIILFLWSGILTPYSIDSYNIESQPENQK